MSERETKAPLEKAIMENKNSDFEYVKRDESSFERKFETKPTTFFKDAIKRFVKNKSSIVAAGILFVLISMAIIVPLADQNNIDDVVESSAYLPPKWFEVNNAHFMDGTGALNDIVLDSKTGQLPKDSSYVQRAVIGEMKTREEKTNVASPSTLNYGKGGSMIIKAVNPSESGGIKSREIEVKASEDLTFKVTLDQEAANANNPIQENYKAFVTATFDKEEVRMVLVEGKTNEQEINVHLSSGILSSSSEYIAAGSPSSYKARFVLNVVNDDNHLAPQAGLYVKKIEATSSDSSNNNLALASFDDATKALGLLKEGSISGSTITDSYLLDGSVSTGIHQSTIVYASFYYDYYEAAFGEEESYVFSDVEIEDFIEKGWIEYEWTGVMGTDTPPGRFVLTEAGKNYSPIRDAKSQRLTSYYWRGQLRTTKSLTGARSLYRYKYYKGWIGTCRSQKYIFGTNKYGQDFFKQVFSGLLTSLSLGLLAAVINLAVGLIFGAISGYFGGWVDILMQRFTEILGGMPWIVLMTLIVLLLGSNFATFLLALCLTGWIGVAAETREQFYRYKGREYVLASRTLGASDTRLIFRHVLPNGIGTIVTGASLMIPSVIFTEANISYLLPNILAFKGSQSFGITLSSAQADLQKYPYLIVSASIIMVLLMVSFNLFGNGLRDAFNPSLKGGDK